MTRSSEPRGTLPPASDALTLAITHEPVEAELEAALDGLSFAERYQDDQVLGSGGMGVVHLQHDRQIGRRVALKVLRDHHAGHGDLEARFVREARLQGQLEHPSVVPVYDLGVDPDGRTYFTMKRVRGVDLHTIIKQLAKGEASFEERFPRRRLLTAFGNVCLAVQFAHERGVVHRDLKPENIMLGDHGEVYVLDWGLAKLLGDDRPVASTTLDVSTLPSTETVAGDMMGTPGFMSPEHVAQGPNAVTPASDLYALGAVLFELLALFPLHPTDSAARAMATTMAGVDARPSARAPERDVPPELDAICQQATAMSPADRHDDARAMHLAIEAYLGGERDVERRRVLAEEHAGRAMVAAESKGIGGEAEIQARRQAMQEVGRALAFDPTNQTAMLALVNLLNEPPDTLPTEVVEELDRAERIKTQWIGRLGTIAYASLFLYLPLLYWHGLRNVTPVVLLYVFTAASVGLSFSAAIRRQPSPWIPMIVMVTTSIAFALTSCFFGALVLTPTLIAVNTTAFALHARGGFRIATIVMGCIAMAVPIALELWGVTGSYQFTEAGILIVPAAIELPKGPVLLLLVVTSLASIVTSCLSATKIRDALDQAETHLHLYAWHLREFAPSTRSVLDPAQALRTWERSARRSR